MRLWIEVDGLFNLGMIFDTVWLVDDEHLWNWQIVLLWANLCIALFSWWRVIWVLIWIVLIVYPIYRVSSIVYCQSLLQYFLIFLISFIFWKCLAVPISLIYVFLLGVVQDITDFVQVIYHFESLCVPWALNPKLLLILSISWFAI